MQSVSYPNYNRYADALAQKRKRIIIKKIVLSAAIGIILAGAVGYVLFFTPYFQIESFSFYGLKTIDQKEIEPVLDSAIKDNVFQIFRSLQIQQQRNILFFNSDVLKERILAQFPIVKSLNVKKEYFHRVVLEFLERTPIGSWCFIDICRYFDGEGVLWGQALKSSGFLLLNINDFRLGQDTVARLESGLLDPILETVNGLNNLEIKVLRVEIPEDSIGDFKVYTSGGYSLILNKELDVKNQINVFRIFLAEKGVNLKTEYVDLRIGGRVYYK